MKEASSSATGSVAGILMAEALATFESLVKPSLVAIYSSHNMQSEKPVQVGTGFLVTNCSRPVLITAKHTLRGETFEDNPGEKSVHVDGKWVYIGDGKRKVVEPKDHDLAMAYMDEFSSTIGGFLARDFKRDSDTLRPAPYIYSNVGMAVGEGLVGLRYPKRLNIDTKTRKTVVTSRPIGLSGCPMLDTIGLITGAVSILGVFTDQEDGRAFGEDASIIRAVMASL